MKILIDVENQVSALPTLTGSVSVMESLLYLGRLGTPSDKSEASGYRAWVVLRCLCLILF